MLVTVWFLWRFFNLLFSWHCFFAFLVRWHCQWILAVWFGMRRRPFIWRTEHQVTFTPSEWQKVQDSSWKLTAFILPRVGYHIMISKCERLNSEQWMKMEGLSLYWGLTENIEWIGKMLSIQWRFSMRDAGQGTVKKHVKVLYCLPCKPL